MKKYIDCLCLCVLLAVCCVACQEEEDASLSRTGFLISLVEAPQVGVEARATPAELSGPLVENFKLKIVRQPNTLFYDDSFKKEIDASQGTYTLTAYCGDNSLGLDRPYYEGTVEAIVSEGQTPVKIEARVANALVSVKYEDEALFKNIYTGGYYVAVEVGSQQINLEDITQSVYFPAGSTVTLYFKGKKEGDTNYQSYELKSSDLPSSFAAGDHAIITLSAQNMGVSIKKAEVTPVEISETIPLEWLPNPKVTVQGFDENHSLTYYETETPEASLQFTTALGLEELKFKVDFQDATYSSLTGEYALSTMTPEEKQKFAEAGITLPEIGSTEKNVMDFEEFITKLQASNDNAVKAVENKITLLEVTANGRTLDSDDLSSYIILVKKKPVFSVSVDERNVWSKEFTVDEVVVTEGDADAVKDGIVYQYSNGDDEWTDCSDGRLQKFESFPVDANRNLLVRAKFRDFVSESVPVEMEEQRQMPNSDMDVWGYETYDITMSSNTGYLFQPWNTEKGISNFWDTNNSFTQRNRYNSTLTRYNYNGFHAVSPVPGRIGWAAEIRNTANGRGNTKFIGHTEKPCNKVAGELFTGSARVEVKGGDSDGESDTYEKTKDSEHPSRPTALKFYYKYVPYTDDVCKVSIELLDEEGGVIISNTKTYSEMTDWKEVTIPLEYNESQVYAKCKYIYVAFYSSDKEVGDVPYREITQTFYIQDATTGELISHTFSPAYVGSVLTIDDISLIYDK